MKSRLTALSHETGIEIPVDLAERLEVYFRLLQHYGTRVNLVGRLERGFLETQVALGSLQILRVGCPRGRLLDVGTGAGVPGLVLGLALPDLQVDLLERRPKRVAFLHRAITELSLDSSCQIIAADADGFRPTVPYDWAVSRAFRDPVGWLSVARQLTADNGIIGFYTTQTLLRSLPRHLFEAARSAPDPTASEAESDRVVATLAAVDYRSELQ